MTGCTARDLVLCEGSSPLASDSTGADLGESPRAVSSSDAIKRTLEPIVGSAELLFVAITWTKVTSASRTVRALDYRIFRVSIG